MDYFNLIYKDNNMIYEKLIILLNFIELIIL